MILSLDLDSLSNEIYCLVKSFFYFEQKNRFPTSVFQTSSQPKVVFLENVALRLVRGGE